MTEVTVTAERSQSLPKRSDIAWLRGELADRFAGAYERTCRYDQLDGLEQVSAYLFYAHHAEGAGGQFHRTWGQMIVGLGWSTQPAGMMYRDWIARYCNSIKRRLDVLVEIGWLHGWEPVYGSDRECKGILVTFTPAGVAQSVVAPVRRRRSPARRRGSRGCGPASISPRVSTPCGSPGRRDEAAGIPEKKLRACAPARTRLRPETRARERWSSHRGAALESLRQLTASREGPEALVVLAEHAGGDPLAVAVVAFEALYDGAHPQLTARRREHLLRHCQQLDRLAGVPGTGVRWLLELMSELPRVARSLGFYVWRLRREARARARAARGLPAVVAGPPSWLAPWRQVRDHEARKQQIRSEPRFSVQRLLHGAPRPEPCRPKPVPLPDSENGLLAALERMGALG